MNKNIISYCSIKNNQVLLNGKLDCSVTEDGSLDSFLNQIYKENKIIYPKYFKMDNLCKLAFLTVERLGMEEHLNAINRMDIGIIISNSTSSLDTDLKYNDSIKNRNNYFPSPAIFVYTLPNIMIGELCIRHRLRGENAFFVSKEYDPKISYNYINNLFDRGRIQACITGWVDIDKDKYESILFLVKKEDTANWKNIFDESTLVKLYKEETN